MTVIEAFESLLSTFVGEINPDLTNYLATTAAIMVFCGLLSLFVGMFTRRAGRYIGIGCIIAIVAVTLNFVGVTRLNLLPEGAVINTWF